MANFVKIAGKNDLPASGEAKEFTCGDKMICIANIEGVLSAMDNVCLHRGGPLGQGIVDGGKVICPWHGWEYDPKTGEASHNPTAKVAVYPVKVEGDDVMVEI
ncbi:MAG TPA: Rieske (2Fe-2S) protein [Terriglobales bacterium]|nr:Rieske (2Fe-2S) protein [Terriglobales bacterium]